MVKKKLEDLIPANATFSVVTTTRAKYFGITEETERGVTVKDSYEYQQDLQPHDIAKHYLRGVLRGENKTVELSDSLVESVQPALDETRLITSYATLLPDARERAIGDMTYQTLMEMMAKPMR